MAWRLAKDNGKTMIYLNFDHMGVSSAQKLKMKHEKIAYFRHYVNRTKIPDDMNKSIILRKSNWDFFSMSILYFYKSKHNFLNLPICKCKVILFINSRFEIGWWVAGARQIAMALYAIPVKAMRP